jgi:hypothetical protein
MNKKTLTALIIAVALIHGAALQVAARASQPGGRAQQEAASTGGSVSISNQSGRVQIKLERGSRVSISNRFGRITITGWDRDTVEASATSDRGAEAVQVEMTADPGARTVLALTVPGRPGRRSTSGWFPSSRRIRTVDINPRISTPAPAAAPHPQAGRIRPDRIIRRRNRKATRAAMSLSFPCREAPASRNPPAPVRLQRRRSNLRGARAAAEVRAALIWT